MPKIERTPPGIKPYTFHGIDLTYGDGDKQAKGDCPFCGKEGKFSVEIETGKYRCWVCGTGSDKGGGNPTIFIRKLYDICSPDETPLRHLAEDRCFLDWQSLSTFGAAVSPINGDIVVPGYNADGVLSQLYRYASFDGKKRRMLGTSTLEHQLFGVPLFDRKKQTVYVCEGVWDAIALWEVLGSVRKDGSEYVLTSNSAASMLATSNVLGVPGANVFNEKWSTLLDGKDVVLCFHSDHPPQNGHAKVLPAGFAGCRRWTKLLSHSEGRPKSLSWIAWGPNGYDPSLAPGYDVRDALKDGEDLAERCRMLADLLSRVKPVPESWVPGKKPGSPDKSKGEVGLDCVPCSDWKTLINAWRKPLKWTEGLNKGLACMLASVVSTMAVGDQLWMRVLGPPSCISGSTYIGFAVRRRKDGKIINHKGGSMETLYRRFNNPLQTNGNPKWQKDVDFLVQSIDEDGKILRREVSDVVFKGVQDVYRVVTRSGKTLETTLDHEYFTGEKYTQLRHLKKGARVYVNPGKVTKKGRAKPPHRPEVLVKYHSNGRTKNVGGYTYYRLRVYQAVYEAYMNKMSYQEYVTVLNTRSKEEIDKLWSIPRGAHIHHIDEDCSNNSLENLQLIDCPVDHAQRHLGNSIKQVSIFVEEDKIDSIEFVGQKRVYDIVCKDPYRNFVAGGVVVHNCGKSTLCEALSVNRKYIHPQSTLRGFHSGFDDGSGENHSPLLKMKDKTLIIKDGDTLLKSPNLDQILSEARDVYDRVSRSGYRNKQSKNHEGLNITVILCGTPSLRVLDTSELGERFLTVTIAEGVDPDLEDEVLWRKINQADQNMDYESGGDPESQYDPSLLKAMQLTGGYVAHLRQNANELLKGVHSPEAMRRKLVPYAKFIAYLRARPSKSQDEVVEREFATRLGSQLMRLAKGLAVVLNKKAIDDDVINIVRSVVLDTAKGRTFEIAKRLAEAGREGLSLGALSVMTGQSEDAERKLLRFMRSIGAVETFIDKAKNNRPRWRLTDTMSDLFSVTVTQGADNAATA